MKRPCVYTLSCADGRFYTGSTTQLAERLRQHEVGEVKVFAARRRPFDLVFVWEFETVPEAAIAERQIKGWTHAKKLALVRGDIELLHELAQCRNASHARHASIKAQ